MMRLQGEVWESDYFEGRGEGKVSKPERNGKREMEK